MPADKTIEVPASGSESPESPQSLAASTGARLEPCPPAEVIAAFVDDRLCAPRHLWTLEHLAGCDHCYPAVAAMLDFQIFEAEHGEGAAS